MTDKLKKLLNECFDARLRELKALKSITDSKEVETQIEWVEAMKSCHNEFGIFEK